MEKCVYCSSDLPSGATICPSCGGAVVTSVAPKPPEPVAQSSVPAVPTPVPPAPAPVVPTAVPTPAPTAAPAAPAPAPIPVVPAPQGQPTGIWKCRWCGSRFTSFSCPNCGVGILEGKVNLAQWGAKIAAATKKITARGLWQSFKHFSETAADRRTSVLAGVLSLGFVLAAILVARIIVIPAFLIMGVGILLFGRRGGFTRKEIIFGIAFFLGGFFWLFLSKVPSAAITIFASVVRCNWAAELGLSALGAVAILVANRSKWSRAELILSVVVPAVVALFLVGLFVPAPTSKVVLAEAPLWLLVAVAVALLGALIAWRSRGKWRIVAIIATIVLLGGVFGLREYAVEKALKAFAARQGQEPKPTAQPEAQASPTANLTAVYLEGVKAGADACAKAVNITKTAEAQAARGEATNTPQPTQTPTETSTPTNTPTNTPTSTGTTGVTPTPTKKSELTVTPTKVLPTNTPVPPTATSKPPEPTRPPENTPVPPTNTPVPPTNTPRPPTNTPVPPTNTPVPSAPPSNTPVPTKPPTNTPVPPTNTPVLPTITPTQVKPK